MRYNYGEEEAEYFKNTPYCESCPEERLATLCIHHVYGKTVKKFKTLCHNCHALVHATKMGHVTYKQLLKQNGFLTINDLLEMVVFGIVVVALGIIGPLISLGFFIKRLYDNYESLRNIKIYKTKKYKMDTLLYKENEDDDGT